MRLMLRYISESAIKDEIYEPDNSTYKRNRNRRSQICKIINHSASHEGLVGVLVS